MGKKISYNYVKLSDVRNILSDKNVFDITFIKTKKGKKISTEFCDVKRVDHIKIVVHNSLSFDILCSKKMRTKYGISREVKDDILIYNIPLKIFKKFQRNNTNFFTMIRYNGDIESFKNKNILALSKWIYLCSKKEILAEVIV